MDSKLQIAKGDILTSVNGLRRGRQTVDYTSPGKIHSDEDVTWVVTIRGTSVYPLCKHGTGRGLSVVVQYTKARNGHGE